MSRRAAALLDEDDRHLIDSDDKIQVIMEIPDGFRLQMSPPTASSGRCEVLARLGMGWFGRLVTRQCQRRTSHLYDYFVRFSRRKVVLLEEDQQTRSMKLPFGGNVQRKP